MLNYLRMLVTIGTHSSPQESRSQQRICRFGRTTDLQQGSWWDESKQGTRDFIPDIVWSMHSEPLFTINALIQTLLNAKDGDPSSTYGSIYCPCTARLLIGKTHIKHGKNPFYPTATLPLGLFPSISFLPTEQSLLAPLCPAYQKHQHYPIFSSRTRTLHKSTFYSMIGDLRIPFSLWRAGTFQRKAVQRFMRSTQMAEIQICDEVERAAHDFSRNKKAWGSPVRERIIIGSMIRERVQKAGSRGVCSESVVTDPNVEQLTEGFSIHNVVCSLTTSAHPTSDFNWMVESFNLLVAGSGENKNWWIFFRRHSWRQNSAGIVRADLSHPRNWPCATSCFSHYSCQTATKCRSLRIAEFEEDVATNTVEWLEIIEPSSLKLGSSFSSLLWLGVWPFRFHRYKVWACRYQTLSIPSRARFWFNDETIQLDALSLRFSKSTGALIL